MQLLPVHSSNAEALSERFWCANTSFCGRREVWVYDRATPCRLYPEQASLVFTTKSQKRARLWAKYQEAGDFRAAFLLHSEAEQKSIYTSAPTPELEEQRLCAIGAGDVFGSAIYDRSIDFGEAQQAAKNASQCYFAALSVFLLGSNPQDISQ